MGVPRSLTIEGLRGDGANSENQMEDRTVEVFSVVLDVSSFQIAALLLCLRGALGVRAWLKSSGMQLINSISSNRCSRAVQFVSVTRDWLADILT